MLKVFSFDDTGMRRLAAAVVLLTFVFEVYVIGANYSNYFLYVLDTETYLFSGITLIFFLLSLYVFYRFILFAVRSSWRYKILFLLLLLTSSFVEYGYQKALGRFTDKADIENAIGTNGEQKLASLAMYLDTRALIPFLLMLGLFWSVRYEKKRGFKEFLATAILAILSFAAFSFLIDKPIPTVASSAFIQTATDFLINGPLRTGKYGSDFTGLKLRRRPIRMPYLNAAYRPDKNIVVVIDESLRGDHLSLNGYNRQTTPFLEKISSLDVFANWGLASSASTGTRFSFNSLVTGLTPDDFPDRQSFKIGTFPTIFQYAKAMKYRTVFFEGQMNAYWAGVEDDKEYLDEFHGILDITDGMAFDAWEIDNKIAGKIKSIIYSSTGNLIFVVKRGSHIPYQANFPPAAATWTPSYETGNRFEIPSGDQLPNVINAYDNSIKFNVDSFFQNMVDDYAAIPNNTVILYTGDHGQTLFVNGRSSHGGSTKAEATVPLFMIGKLGRKPDTTYRASHANIFPTVLDLLDYPEELRDNQKFPSLLKARSTDSRQRFFNPDLGSKVPFD